MPRGREEAIWEGKVARGSLYVPHVLYMPILYIHHLLTLLTLAAGSVQAADLLLFLVLDMGLPASVKPPLGPSECRRVKRWYAAIRLRQYACMSALNWANSGGAIGGPS